MEVRVPKLYVDMDGVLADFDKHYEDVFGTRPNKVHDNVDWKAVRRVKDFYADIPPMWDMKVLWGYLERYKPTVLTGIPSSLMEEATRNKRAWIKRNLGPHVPVICCMSRNKAEYAEKGDILIDDWDKYKTLWEARGGRWITHTNAFNTIERLQELGL